MDIFETIKNRFSVRKYQARAVPDEDLSRILEAGRLAPSAHNSQNYKIVIVRDEKSKQKLSNITNMPFVAQAPIVLVGIAIDPSSGYYPVDMAIIFDHISLSATSLGLGSCWIGSIKDEARIREVVKAPKDSKALIIMPLGYSDQKSLPKKRKSFEEIFSEEKY